MNVSPEADMDSIARQRGEKDQTAPRLWGSSLPRWNQLNESKFTLLADLIIPSKLCSMELS
jgi:hypothetical protein